MIYRTEYPNPQFERKNWLCLNGEWDFEIDKSASGFVREFYKNGEFTKKINVPFCPESELSGIGDIDFYNCVWYRKTINITKEQLENAVVINFGAVDYIATLYVNGEEVGKHKGGYISFSFDITKYLVEGENVIVLAAEDDVRCKTVPSGKQSDTYDSHGCYYTRTTGIWQSVWLEFVPKNRIKNFKITPDVDNLCVDISAKFIGDGDFTVEISYEGKEMGKCTKKVVGGIVNMNIPLAEAHLWELGNGRLYDMKLTFGDDEVYSYFGLRSARMEGMKFLLNGKSVFQRLVLDQGYYPDGIYTAPTEEILKRDIELSLAVGFNGARLHEKIFEPRFLYHCDKMGYMVWGEYPNWGLDHSNPDSLDSVLPEWIEELERDYNHPSIVAWCPFNETWDYMFKPIWQPILKTIYAVTKQIDPIRPCVDASGNFHVITDIFDVHDYDQNPESLKEHYDTLVTEGTLYDAIRNRFPRARQHYNGEPVFISEYGGIRWVEEDKEGWGYGRTPESPEAFIERYTGLTEAILQNEKISGFCYTQLYDVEQEQNGLYTYWREPKFDPEIFRKVTSQKAAIED